MASPVVGPQFSNLSCAYCHQTEQSLDQRLQRCKGCLSISYCSRQCQRQHWPSHKPQCPILKERGIPSSDYQLMGCRTTMRMRMNLFAAPPVDTSSDTADDPNIIYYLRVSTPHCHVIDLNGPIPTVAHLAHDIFDGFGPECFRGREQLTTLLKDNQPPGSELLNLEHITSAIGNDQSKTRTCRIIREINPVVRAHLLTPGGPWSVYHVLSMDVNTEIAESMEEPGPDDPLIKMPLRDFDVHGTFLEEGPAFARAAAVAQELASEVHGSVVGEIPCDNGIEVKAFSVQQLPPGSGAMINVVVKHGDGVTSNAY